MMHPFLDAKLREVSQARNAVFAHMKRNRPLGKDYENVGLCGEWEFGKFCGMMPNTRPGPDGGIDFELPVVFTVDVKTSRKGDKLLVEAGKVKADIYVLAHYTEEEQVDLEARTVWEVGSAKLVGWAFATQLKAREPYNTGRGIINYCMQADELRPMSELARMMGRVKRG